MSRRTPPPAAAQTGPAHLVELIRTAAVQVQAASLAGDESTSALLTPALAEVLGDWLFGAAQREQTYRLENPGWSPPAATDEAWTAGLLACQLLGIDPTRYDIEPPTED